MSFTAFGAAWAGPTAAPPGTTFSHGQAMRNDRLLGGAGGSVRILWREVPAMPGKQCAVERLDMTAAPRPSDGRYWCDPPADPQYPWEAHDVEFKAKLAGLAAGPAV